MHTPHVYGLTGGIACGKSTALEAFVRLGIDTIDADQIAREVIAPGSEGATALKAAIGESFFNSDQLDRSALRNALYRDALLKQTVESIVHPRVKAIIDAWRVAPTAAPYKILCSPLLLETGHHPDLEGIIVVDVPPETQRARASSRDQTDPKAIQSIMDQQMDRATRLDRATFVLDNSGTPEALIKQVTNLHKRLLRD